MGKGTGVSWNPAAVVAGAVALLVAAGVAVWFLLLQPGPRDFPGYVNVVEAAGGAGEDFSARAFDDAGTEYSSVSSVTLRVDDSRIAIRNLGLVSSILCMMHQCQVTDQVGKGAYKCVGIGTTEGEGVVIEVEDDGDGMLVSMWAHDSASVTRMSFLLKRDMDESNGVHWGDWDMAVKIDFNDSGYFDSLAISASALHHGDQSNSLVTEEVFASATESVAWSVATTVDGNTATMEGKSDVDGNTRAHMDQQLLHHVTGASLTLPNEEYCDSRADLVLGYISYDLYDANTGDKVFNRHTVDFSMTAADSVTGFVSSCEVHLFDDSDEYPALTAGSTHVAATNAFHRLDDPLLDAETTFRISIPAGATISNGGDTATDASCGITIERVSDSLNVPLHDEIIMPYTHVAANDREGKSRWFDTDGVTEHTSVYPEVTLRYSDYMLLDIPSYTVDSGTRQSVDAYALKDGTRLSDGSSEYVVKVSDGSYAMKELDSSACGANISGVAGRGEVLVKPRDASAVTLQSIRKPRNDGKPAPETSEVVVAKDDSVCM